MLIALKASGKQKHRVVLVALVVALFAFAFAAIHLSPTVLAAGCALLLFPIVALSFSLAGFDARTIAIVLGGLTVYLTYLTYTEFGERNYDAGDELRYIVFIVEHHARPPASYCLVCHHPPLYFALGAVVYVFFEATKLAAPTTGLQLFGLVCHLVFLAYAIATARRFLGTSRDLYLAAALIVFWPYGIESSVRLHNDSLATTLMCAATFYLVRWTQEDEPRDLYRAALVTGFGLLTKSSAYAIVFALVVVVLARFVRSRDKWRVAGRGAVACLLLLSGVLLNARGKESPSPNDAVLCHKILGTACDIDKSQWVDNTPKDYVSFDVGTFLREPYAFADREGSARAYFWNHLLKSSLFGTHNSIADVETSYVGNRETAIVMSAILLGMVVYLAGVGIAFARRRAIQRFGVVLVCVASCVALMIGFRALIPAPHHSDFRHIFSTVAPVATLYAAATARAHAFRPWLGSLGRTLALAFIALSIVYFVPKQDLLIRVTRHVVRRDLARYGRVVPERTPWDASGNLVIAPNEIVELAVADRPTARALDISLDGNDVYKVDIVGDETRTLMLGPRPGTMGLARYVEWLSLPVTNVRAIRVQPVTGDYAYSLGHVLVIGQ